MSEFHVCYKGSNVIFYQLYEHLKENSRNELNYVIAKLFGSFYVNLCIFSFWWFLNQGNKIHFWKT